MGKIFGRDKQDDAAAAQNPGSAVSAAITYSPEESSTNAVSARSGGKKKKKKKGLKIAIVIVLAAALGTGGYFFFHAKNSGATIVYNEATATVQDLSTSYSFDGFISSSSSQTVYASGLMTVDSINVSVGDTVSEGDLLVTYEQDDTNSLSQAQNSLSAAQLQLETAEKSLERTKALYEKGGVSLQEYENAQNSYTSAQLNVTQAQESYQSAAEKLDDYSVYAKISGMVVSVSANEGEDLTSGSEVMEIISYDDLEIEITIDEYDMQNLSEGQEAIITINSTGDTVKGYISELSRKASTQNGVSYFSGVVKISEPNDSISVGTSAEVTIVTSEAKDVLTVPVGAVQYNSEDGTYYVLVKDGAEMVETTVETGTNNGVLVEITSGIEEGTTVMIPTYANESSDEESTEEGFSMDMGGGAMPSGGMPSGGGNGGSVPSGGGMPSGGGF